MRAFWAQPLRWQLFIAIVLLLIPVVAAAWARSSTVLALGVIVWLMAALVVSRRLTSAVGHLDTIAQRIAGGDFSPIERRSMVSREFVELQELQRIYIFDIGGPHTYRTIYMDGRSHPATLSPSYYGHSIGWWESDTLVVDTIGFNEGFRLDRRGSPHTEQLHTVERFTRKDEANMQYEVLFDDPGAYTKPWKSGFALRHDGNVDLFEYVCQQMNYAHELMVGSNDSVDRRSPIIP